MPEDLPQINPDINLRRRNFIKLSVFSLGAFILGKISAPFLTSNGNSGNSNLAQVGVVGPPTTPTGLVVTPVSSSQVNLAWTPSTDNTGVANYKVYRQLGLPTTPPTPTPEPAPTSGTSPVLWFSDLNSGPKSGNTDTSIGQSSGVDGVIVSVWGSRLGSSQGSSTVTCNGAVCPIIHYWGNAVPPYSPATLYNDYQKMQVVMFQVPSLALTGLGNITITVGQETSNQLPFTVRSGRIFYVATTGVDSGNSIGSWTKPFLTLSRARSIATAAGDTVYLRNGVNTGGVQFLVGGTEAAPLAFVAYPGAVCQMNNTLSFRPVTAVPANPPSHWHTISKFSLATFSTQGLVVNAKTGGRIVANHIEAPNGNDPTGACVATGGVNKVKYLGNECTNIGLATGGSHLYHVFYPSGSRGVQGAPDEGDREFAYNYIHNCGADSAFQIYTQQNNGFAARIRNIHVHHNVVVDQVSDGIKLTLCEAPTTVHHNLFVRCGGAGINIRGGFELNHLEIYNNTVVDCGGNGLDQGSLNFSGSNAEGRVKFLMNNIFVQTTGFQYLTPHSKGTPTAPNAAKYANNLWYGAGAAPSWDTNPINANPLFVGGTPLDVHLQAGSPALNVGNAAVTGGTSAAAGFFDLDGTQRPQGVYDIGVYETFVGTG